MEFVSSDASLCNRDDSVKFGEIDWCKIIIIKEWIQWLGNQRTRIALIYFTEFGGSQTGSSLPHIPRYIQGATLPPDSINSITITVLSPSSFLVLFQWRCGERSGVKVGLAFSDTSITWVWPSAIRSGVDIDLIRLIYIWKQSKTASLLCSILVLMCAGQWFLGAISHYA
jgi:hypothetical protein